MSIIRVTTLSFSTFGIVFIMFYPLAYHVRKLKPVLFQLLILYFMLYSNINTRNISRIDQENNRRRHVNFFNVHIQTVEYVNVDKHTDQYEM